MTSQEFADRAIQDLKRIAAAAQKPGLAVTAPALDPRAVLIALAEGLKLDGANAQAVAVRINNLIQRYPRRAY